jgi:hypothetical protein
MGNPKFNIGDKVKTHSERGRGVNGVAYVSSMDEYSGVIARVEDINGTNDNGVEKWFYRLENTPFYWHESLLEAVNNESKVVITTDGTITRAAMYDGHKLIKEAFSTCSKEEAFDFEKGAKIAFERLTAKPAEPKPKKELKPLDTKIFVLDGDDILKSSHIYEVKNGKIRAFIGSYPSKGTLYNMTDVVNYLKPSSQRNGEEKYDSNGVKLSVYDNRKQITVMEVKEG